MIGSPPGAKRDLDHGSPVSDGAVIDLYGGRCTATGLCAILSRWPLAGRSLLPREDGRPAASATESAAITLLRDANAFAGSPARCVAAGRADRHAVAFLGLPLAGG